MLISIGQALLIIIEKLYSKNPPPEDKIVELAKLWIDISNQTQAQYHDKNLESKFYQAAQSKIEDYKNELSTYQISDELQFINKEFCELYLDEKIDLEKAIYYKQSPKDCLKKLIELNQQFMKQKNPDFSEIIELMREKKSFIDYLDINKSPIYKSLLEYISLKEDNDTRKKELEFEVTEAIKNIKSEFHSDANRVLNFLLSRKIIFSQTCLMVSVGYRLPFIKLLSQDEFLSSDHLIDYAGESVLHTEARFAKDSEILEELLSNKKIYALLNSTNRWGLTPLDRAYQGHCAEVVRFLEQKGAKRGIKREEKKEEKPEIKNNLSRQSHLTSSQYLNSSDDRSWVITAERLNAEIANREEKKEEKKEVKRDEKKEEKKEEKIASTQFSFFDSKNTNVEMVFEVKQALKEVTPSTEQIAPKSLGFNFPTLGFSSDEPLETLISKMIFYYPSSENNLNMIKQRFAAFKQEALDKLDNELKLPLMSFDRSELLKLLSILKNGLEKQYEIFEFADSPDLSEMSAVKRFLYFINVLDDHLKKFNCKLNEFNSDILQECLTDINSQIDQLKDKLIKDPLSLDNPFASQRIELEALNRAKEFYETLEKKLKDSLNVKKTSSL